MFTFVSIIHVVMCLILIIIVLLQTGKGSDLASAFGGGGSNTMFGSQGAASFLNRLTTIAAIMFMLTSLALAILSAQPDKSILDDILPADAPASVPVQGSGDVTVMPEGSETAPAAPAQDAPVDGSEATSTVPDQVPPADESAAEVTTESPEGNAPASEAMPETGSGE